MKILFIIAYLLSFGCVKAQDIDPVKWNAIKADDTTQLSKFVTRQNVNDCFGTYSLLSHSVRLNAPKSAAYLLSKGADVNKICGDYIPPLMHAVKYSSLNIVKLLIEKGADVKYVYHGNDRAVLGGDPDVVEMSLLKFAQRFKRAEIEEYLKTLGAK